MNPRVAGLREEQFRRIAVATGVPLLIALAGLLYIISASGNLWMDEILSLQWARNAKAWTDIITLFRHDNNHPLNTLWLYLVGDGQVPLVYRAVSILAGIGSLVLLERIARRLVPRARLFVLTIAVMSYSLAVFFSEARGYAMAVFAELLAFWILLAYEERPTLVAVAGFWASAVVGFLSHATFVYPLGGMGVWLLVSGLRNKGIKWRVISSTAVWFAVPVVLFVAYYLYYLRQMLIAGGPDIIVLQVAAEFFGFGLGMPVQTPFSYATVAISVVAMLASLVFGRFEVKGIRIFFLSALGVLPCIGLLVTHPDYLHFRYFLVLLPFVLLLLGGLIERALNANRRWAFAVVLLLAAALAFQWPRFAALLTVGRGGYPDVLERMASLGHPVVFSATHDMMGGLVLEHYRRQIAPLPAVHFRPAARLAGSIPEWFLVVDQSHPPTPAAEAIEIFDRSYRFDTAVYSAPVSGAHWYLYRLIKPKTPNEKAP